MSPLERIAAVLGFRVVILPEPVAGSRESAIRFLVERLIEDGSVQTKSTDEVVGWLLRREQLGSTALGGGIALPHSLSLAVDRVVGILARSSCGVPWESPDGQLVTTICLVLAPADRPEGYMRALQQVAHAMRLGQG